MRKLTDAPDMWINVRMRRLLAEDFCPACNKHRVLHEDKKCDMRWVNEEEEQYEVA